MRLVTSDLKGIWCYGVSCHAFECVSPNCLKCVKQDTCSISTWEVFKPWSLFGNNIYTTQETTIGLPYDPVFPFVGIYSSASKSLFIKDICIHKFILELFLIAKVWKSCTWTDKENWIRNIDTIDYYLAVLEREIMQFFYDLDRYGGSCAECVSQK